MALSSNRVVIPLERISYVTTPTLTKKDLVQWTHISGRSDLTVVFEKEPFIGSNGYCSEQTMLKVKEGITLMDTVVLEDFVCQALVAQRNATSSPTTPRSFAIFMNCPDLAFRYQLVTGEFRKFQLMFKDEAGFNTVIDILKHFDLPLTERSAISSRGRNTSANARSISEKHSQGASTVFSGYQGSMTTGTSQTWFEQPGFDYNAYQQPSSAVAASGSSRFSSRFLLQPGPSIAESSISLYQPPNYSGPRAGRTEVNAAENLQSDRTGHFKPSHHLGSSINQELNPATCFTNRPITSVRPVDFIPKSFEPSWLSSSMPGNNSSYSPKRMELLKATHSSSQVMAQSDPRNERILHGTEASTQSDKIEPGQRPIPVATPNSLLSKSKSSAKDKSTVSQPPTTKKPAPRKRAPRKVFTTASTQTVQIAHTSMSTTTQTDDFHFFPSAATQTDAVVFANTDGLGKVESGPEDVAALVDLIRGASLFLSAPTYSSIQPLGDDAAQKQASLLPQKGPRINKFGRRAQVGLTPCTRSQRMVTLPVIGGPTIGHPHAQISIQCRKINKFKIRAG